MSILLITTCSTLLINPPIAKEANIDHVIVRAPNTQLSAGRCKLTLDTEADGDFWSKPLVLLLGDVYEKPMQPFPPNNEIVSKNGAIIAHSHLEPPAKNAVNGGVKELTKGSAVITSETRSGKMRGSGFFFRPGAKFNVTVYEDGGRSKEDVKWASFELGRKLGMGTLELGQSVYVDSEGMNFDPFKKVERVAEWKREFDSIGKELE